jgi:hypothetical protein
VSDFSWLLRCLLRRPFCLKLFLQILQVYDCFWLWACFMWWSRQNFPLNFLLQMLQSNMVPSSWFFDMCFERFEKQLKVFLQCSHLYFFSPLKVNCTNYVWTEFSPVITWFNQRNITPGEEADRLWDPREDISGGHP